MDLSKLSPAPWDNQGGDIGTDKTIPPPKGFENNPACGAVLFSRDFATDDDCEFIALARNAFAVMMSRGWVSHRGFDGGWRVVNDAGNIVQTGDEPAFFSNPFEALVVADEWMRSHENQ